MKSRAVFINCPFSRDYQEHFRAIVFAVVRSGFRPRCALETDDGTQNRFDKICEIVRDCRLGIHDISKTEPDKKTGLPRFNMPLELGVFLGAKKFGQGSQRRKRCIILDREPFRYQKFMSDISGQDIHTHKNDIDILIVQIASWLRAESNDKSVPGGKVITKEFRMFSNALPKIAKDQQLTVDELTYPDYLYLAAEWISRVR